jgi:hypothetical protein
MLQFSGFITYMLSDFHDYGCPGQPFLRNPATTPPVLESSLRILVPAMLIKKNFESETYCINDNHLNNQQAR